MSRSTMTSAAMNTGNQIGSRSSTRVTGPPGGASSFSLGWDAPAPAPAPRAAAPAAAVDPYRPSAVASYSAARAAPAPAPVIERADSREHAMYGASAGFGAPVAAPKPVEAVSLDVGSGSSSSNSYASGANQNAGNVLTDRRTTRVLAAPGGRSSLVLG